MRRLGVLALGAFLAAGCGGRQAPATDAAELVPARASAYVVVAPNALARAQAALARFGRAGAAIPYLRAGSTARLAGGIVGFARPANEKAFDRRLDRLGEQHAKVRGWIVYARTRALVDAVKKSKRSLADTARYRRAAPSLPRDAAVRAYASYAGGWRTGALSLAGSDTKLEVHTPSEPGKVLPTIGGEIPAGAVVAASGSFAHPPPGSGPAIDALRRLTGADVRGLISTVAGPWVLYAIPGTPVPDVTFAAAGGSPVFERELRSVVGKLAGSPVPKGPAALDLGPVTLDYGPIAGRYVLSDADDPAAELRDGRKLLASARFRDVAEAAGMPADNEGFFFVDATRTLAAARTLAALANRPVPPELVRALAPVRFLLDWEGHADRVRTTTYLRVS